MVTFCWTVVRHVAPLMHRHALHLAHRSGKILHHLSKFAHHPIVPTMMVCRALPLALASASLVHIAPTQAPGHPAVPPAYVEPVQQGQFVPPYQPSGPPLFPSPFACCGQFQPPGDPGYRVMFTPPVSDPGPTEDPSSPITFMDQVPSSNAVDEPSSGLVVLGAIGSLLLFRQLRISRAMPLPGRTGRKHTDFSWPEAKHSA